VPRCGVVASDGRQNKQIDTRICKANTALLELCCSMFTKWELSNNAKLVLCSDPHLWPWILGKDWKSAISSQSRRQGGFWGL